VLRGWRLLDGAGRADDETTGPPFSSRCDLVAASVARGKSMITGNEQHGVA